MSRIDRAFLISLLGNVCSVFGGYLVGKGFLGGFAVIILGGYLIGLSFNMAEKEARRR